MFVKSYLFLKKKIKSVHIFIFLWLTLQSVGVPFLTEIALLSIVQQEWQKKKWPAIKPMWNETQWNLSCQWISPKGPEGPVFLLPLVSFFLIVISSLIFFHYCGWCDYSSYTICCSYIVAIFVFVIVICKSLPSSVQRRIVICKPLPSSFHRQSALFALTVSSLTSVVVTIYSSTWNLSPLSPPLVISRPLPPIFSFVIEIKIISLFSMSSCFCLHLEQRDK